MCQPRQTNGALMKGRLNLESAYCHTDVLNVIQMCRMKSSKFAMPNYVEVSIFFLHIQGFFDVLVNEIGLKNRAQLPTN